MKISEKSKPICDRKILSYKLKYVNFPTLAFYCLLVRKKVLYNIGEMYG